MVMAQIIVRPLRLVIRYEQSYEIFHEYHQCLLGLHYIVLPILLVYHNFIPCVRLRDCIYSFR
jgi:hypothetical protein